MEEFLGVLFCGGRGTRLGEITKYISKSFIPVYDKPVFKFGLTLLEKSKIINEIIILSNKDNDRKLRQTGYKTIIQNDTKVSDMLSGWEFIKKTTGTKKNGVLVPSDNICEVSIDFLIRKFQKKKADFLFSIHEVRNKKKLSEMGSYDVKEKKFTYKDPNPETKYGVIAPYIIKNNLIYIPLKNIFEHKNAMSLIHNGDWFDTGDYDSIAEANKYYNKNK